MSFNFIGVLRTKSCKTPSQSSEELLQRGGGGGEGKHICHFGEGLHAMKHTSQSKVAASPKKQISS